MKPSTMERLEKAINSYKGGDYYFLQEMKKEGIIYFDDDKIDNFALKWIEIYSKYDSANISLFFNDAMRLDEWLLQRGESTTSTREARQSGPLRDGLRFLLAMYCLECLGMASVIKDGKKRNIKTRNISREKTTVFDKIVIAIKEKEKLKTPPPEPLPQDIQADIHLMAMTILEKLQPVLLNAIYTELMEHKK